VGRGATNGLWHHGSGTDCAWAPTAAWGGPVEHEQRSLQPCPGEGPGVPKCPHGLQHLEANPGPPCHVTRGPVPGDAGWSPVLAHQSSSAEGNVHTRAPPTPGAAPQEGFGVAGGSRQPSAPGASSLLCARRLAGRMAWRSLVLLPFLLMAGEDFAQWLSWVGGRHWRDFQPPILVPNSLRAAGTPRTVPTPLAPWRPNGNLAAPGQGREDRVLGSGDGTQHGCYSWRSSMVWRWEVWDVHEEGEGWWVPLPLLETQTTAGSWGWR